MVKNKIIKNEDYLFDNSSQQIYEYIETNYLMNKLYSKPQRISFSKSIIGTIKYKHALYKFKKEEIMPVYNKLLTESPDFNVMYMYSDFIRLLERVFFYRNALDRYDDNTPKVDKLVCDSDINSTNKILILDLENENVMITFNIYKENEQCIIDMKVRYEFGKKSTMNYKIVDRHIEYDSIHSENLMITIIDRLQKAMANLFLDYYNKI